MPEILDRPALGAYLARPDVKHRRRQAQWLVTQSLNDYRARLELVEEFAQVFDRFRIQQPWPVVAEHLARLMVRVAQTPARLAALGTAGTAGTASTVREAA